MAAKLKTKVVSADYRVAPEYKFPARAATHAVAETRSYLPTRSFWALPETEYTIVGDSAGGNWLRLWP